MPNSSPSWNGKGYELIASRQRQRAHHQEADERPDLGERDGQPPHEQHRHQVLGELDPLGQPLRRLRRWHRLLGDGHRDVVQLVETPPSAGASRGFPPLASGNTAWTVAGFQHSSKYSRIGTMTSATDSGLSLFEAVIELLPGIDGDPPAQDRLQSVFTAPPWLSPRSARARAWRRISSNRASPGLGAPLNQAATREGMRSSAATRGRWSTRFISLRTCPHRTASWSVWKLSRPKSAAMRSPATALDHFSTSSLVRGAEGPGNHREQVQRDDRRHEDRPDDVGRQERPRRRRQHRVDPVALSPDRSHR